MLDTFYKSNKPMYNGKIKSKVGDSVSVEGITYYCTYHVVFCTKYKKEVLVGSISERLVELTTSKVLELGASVKSIEICPTHVDMIIECNTQFGIHRVIKHVKAYTYKFLCSEYKELSSKLPSLWTNTYYVETIGSIDYVKTRSFIKNEKGRGD